MENFVSKIALNLAKKTRKPVADLLDVYFGYRLILNREPDQQGWDSYKQFIKRTRSVEDLSEGFLYSEERKAKQEAHEIQIVDVDGFQIAVDPEDVATGRTVFTTKSYESNITSVVISLLTEDAVFLDIGANIGWFTLLAARIAKKGKVIAVEANPRNIQLIFRGIAENAFTNCVVYPLAATQNPVVLEMHSTNSNGFVSALGQGRDGVTRVQGMPLDDVLACESRLDLVKIDIEGHEPSALLGMSKLLSKHRPSIITEFHPRCLRELSHVEPESYADMLLGMGYRLSVIELDGSLTPAQSATDVMNQWRNASTHAKDGDAHHIDLLAQR